MTMSSGKVSLLSCLVLCLILNIDAGSLRLKRQWVWDEEIIRVPSTTTSPINNNNNNGNNNNNNNNNNNGLDLNCQSNCLRFTTNEYNPICGSDNVTYDNQSKLKCAAVCGKANLDLDYHGPCS
nr:probable basic-leucine zipper transcription factor E isoform X2 [Onthophagus taurus]